MTLKLRVPVRLLREPLLHFVVIGALLFLIFHFWGTSSSEANRIVITPGQIDSMVAGFTRTWQRPPTEQELKIQLDEYVREEMATRQAMLMGLDRDDTIIRRRLRQKLEFLVEDSFDAMPPTEAELQAWFSQHAASFRSEARVALRQVYLDPERRRATLEVDARNLLERLSKSGPDAKIETMTDSVMLPPDMERATRSEVARLFGERFADEILQLEPGRWVGPIRSGYGVHIVFVRERENSHVPTFADVRPQVERDFMIDRRRLHLEAMYTELLKRARVVIEKRDGGMPAAAKIDASGSGSSK